MQKLGSGGRPKMGTPKSTKGIQAAMEDLEKRMVWSKNGQDGGKGNGWPYLENMASKTVTNKIYDGERIG